MGAAYTYPFKANGQPAPSYQLVTGPNEGSPPGGLKLEADGTLHGTPQPGTEGNYLFRVAASNPAGTLLSSELTITINAAQ